MPIDPAILGAAVILNGSSNQPDNSPTCTIQMHDGSSSKGLECIVQPIHQMSNGELFLYLGGSVGFILLFFGSMLLWEYYSNKKAEERYRQHWEEQKKKNKYKDNKPMPKFVRTYK